MKHEWVRVPWWWMQNMEDPHTCRTCGIIRNPKSDERECKGTTKMRPMEVEMVKKER